MENMTGVGAFQECKNPAIASTISESEARYNQHFRLSLFRRKMNDQNETDNLTLSCNCSNKGNDCRAI